MIAAICWPSASGALPEVEKRLARLGAGLGAAPRICTGATGALAAWDLAPEGRIDSRRGAAWIGSLRGLPERLDLAACAQLRGDFAVAALGEGDELLLARGRFGGRPLFYTQLEGVLVACSRLPPLVALLSDAPRMDREAVLAILRVRSAEEATCRTVYEGILRVRSCEALALGGSEVRRVRWGVDVAPHPRASTDELAEELDARVRQAVRRSLAGRRRVAVALSGGLDSSWITAAAVVEGRAANVEVEAFSVDCEGPGNDAPHRRVLCEALGITPRLLRPEALAFDMKQALVIDGAPMPWATVSFVLALQHKARADRCDALLTGIGGDGLFDGEPRYLCELAWRGHPIEALLGAARLRVVHRSSAMRRMRHYVASPLLKRLLPAALLAHLRRPVPACADWAGPLLRRPCSRASDQGPWDRELRRIDAEARSWMYDALVAEPRGQIEAVTGLVRLDPLLDEDVFDFLAGLPSEALFAGGWQRGLQRRAMERLVPRSVCWRSTKADLGRGAIACIESAGGFDALRPLGSASALDAAGIVDSVAFERDFDAAVARPAQQHTRVAHLWMVLALEAFAREARGFARAPF